jgi:hypothetical protein
MSDDRLSVLDPLATMLEAPEPSFEGFLRRRRRRHRHQRIAAGLAVAVLLGAGSLVVHAAQGDTAGTNVPAGPGPVPTTAPVRDALLLPPEGAPPSQPETGEVVASIWWSEFSTEVAGGWPSQIYLYADGRLLWLPDDDVPGGIVERHLSADDVERVRSEFLATGLFDPDHPANQEAWSACECFLWVRDGGRLLSTVLPDSDLNYQSDPEVDRQVDQLIASVTALDPSLPPGSESDDPDLRPYVPSRYRVCVTGVGQGAPEALSDAARVLRRRLPSELARLLAGVRTDPLSPEFACDALTMEEARELVDGLATVEDAEPIGTFDPGFLLAPRGAVAEEVGIVFSPILPHGQVSGTYMGEG